MTNFAYPAAGVRYVLQNGETTDPLIETGLPGWPFTDPKSGRNYRANGMEGRWPSEFDLRERIKEKKRS